MECIEGFDEKVSFKFVNSWINKKVSIKWVTFAMMEELIAKVGGLSLESKSWHK